MTTRIYDIATNTWTTGAPIPEPTGLTDHMTAYSNGKIYVAGGYNGSAVLNTLRIYDIATNSWTTGAPMPDAGFSGRVRNHQREVVHCRRWQSHRSVQHPVHL